MTQDYSIEISTESNTQSPFDQIKHVDENGNEYWLARELMLLLGYPRWSDSKDVLEKAKENIETVTGSVFEHILPLEVKTSGRPLLDYRLSRLAAYHVALCCNSRGKNNAKLAQSYFAAKLVFADAVIEVVTGQKVDPFTDINKTHFHSLDKSGFVYLVASSQSNFYKIGKSKKPYKRMESMQTGTPFELVMIERIFSLDCSLLEKKLHEYYDAYKIRGEWFEFSQEIIREFLLVANSLDTEAENESTMTEEAIALLFNHNQPGRQLLLGEDPSRYR